MLKTLRNVRKALKQWHALPAAERDQYKHHVDRIRSFVAELGGQQAVNYVNGSVSDPPAQSDKNHPPKRPRADVIHDLRTETSVLLTALGDPAAELAKNSVPTSARVGAKLVGKGLRKVSGYGRHGQ